MAVKTSEMITLRTNLAQDLEAGLGNYLESVADGYGEFLAPVLEEGEAPIDVHLQLTLLRRSVAWQRGRLETLDDRVVVQSNEDVKVSSEIGKRTAELAVKLSSIRDTCRGVFGPESLERAGLKGALPRSPVRLHRRALLVRRSLGNPESALEPVLTLAAGEEALAPVQLADELEPELGALGLLVDARHQGRRKSADVRSRRRRTIAEFDQVIRAIVRMAQGMFRLAGRDDLARRFRPILRRVLRRLDEAKAREQAPDGSKPDGAQPGTAEPGTAPAETEGAETSGDAGSGEASETAASETAASETPASETA